MTERTFAFDAVHDLSLVDVVGQLVSSVVVTVWTDCSVQPQSVRVKPTYDMTYDTIRQFSVHWSLPCGYSKLKPVTHCEIKLKHNIETPRNRFRHVSASLA